MKPRDQITYADLEDRVLGNRRLRDLVRMGMTIVVFIFLGLAYSLSYVKAGTPEHVVAILTLALNALLFLGMLITALVLKKRHTLYTAMMEERASTDKADPWVPGASPKTTNSPSEGS